MIQVPDLVEQALLRPAAGPLDRSNPGKTSGPTPALVEQALVLAREQLEMDVAYISEWRAGQQVMRQLDGDAGSFGFAVGSANDLADTYCARVVDGRLPEVIPDSGAIAESRDLAITRRARIGAYVGIPITFSDGRQYGMLCCLSHDPAATLTHRDARFLRVLAGLIATQLESTERASADAAARRGLIETILAERRYRVVGQPIVALETRRIVGLEALARFADGATRPPNLWFAEAHAVGLGIELELALIEAAIAKLPDLPPAAWLSVNASPRTAMSGGFARLIRAAGRARRLVLEVTEHAEVDDYDALCAALAPLRRIGMRVSIDDAGAGFASLSHIRHLEPDIIKLDLSLTRDIDTDEVRGALAESLARFATRIGAQIVAEGVETPAEAEALRRVGIGYGQGYLFGRPADIEPRPRLTGIGSPSRHRRAPRGATGPAVETAATRGAGPATPRGRPVRGPARSRGVLVMRDSITTRSPDSD